MDVAKKVNPVLWLIRYFREAKEEMKKVTWPTKQEILKYSILVIALAIIVAAFFGALDWALSLGLEQLIRITS